MSKPESTVYVLRYAFTISSLWDTDWNYTHACVKNVVINEFNTIQVFPQVFSLAKNKYL